MTHHLTNDYTAPQFDRKRNGSLYNRGRMDKYYGGKARPHWWPAGTGNGKEVIVTEPTEIAEYMAGFHDEDDRKDWGDDDRDCRGDI